MIESGEFPLILNKVLAHARRSLDRGRRFMPNRPIPLSADLGLSAPDVLCRVYPALVAG